VVRGVGGRKSDRGGNRRASPDDYLGMRCTTCQEALSARLDGEGADLSLDQLDAHVAECADCRRFSLRITDIHRMVRVRRAEPVPDLTRTILDAADAGPAAHTPAPPRTASGWLRYGLVVIGVTMLALALPALVLHDTGDAIHMTRELSAWDAAFGAGLLFAAWQPARARGLLPMAAVLAGAQLVGSIIDITSGRSPVVSEAHHVLELVGVLLLWLLCRTVGAARRSSSGAMLQTA
jgi:predicted anti-sigma-YlaC factor YlaD